MPAAIVGFEGTGVGRRAWLLFTLLFLSDIAVLAVAWLRADVRPAGPIAGGIVFVILLLWIGRYLTQDLLWPVLAAALALAILHGAWPAVQHSLRPAPAAPFAHAAPVMALMLLTWTVWVVPSFAVWPVVLFVDAVAILMATFLASALAILVALMLTALLAVLWFLRLPEDVANLNYILIVAAGFGAFFTAAVLFALGKLGSRTTAPSALEQGPLGAIIARQLTALAVIMPLFLLVLVVLRLPLPNPSAVFAVALLLVLVFLGVTRYFRSDPLSLAAVFAAVLLLEHAWYLDEFNPDLAALAVGWYFLFGATFFLFPLVTRMPTNPVPGIVSALALPGHFWLLHYTVKRGWPELDPGFLPAALAVPCLAALAWVRATATPGEERTRLMAGYGGAALLFITLIFPVQFERQWISIGWALEGAALFWLYRRVPHPWLRHIGFALLVIAFGRLSLNPEVLTYEARQSDSVFNWFLYAYGCVSASLLVAARLSGDHKLEEIRTRPILYSLGIILLFILLNIEIANYYSTGPSITFRFTASLGQDMTYSLAWAVFAFGLLAVGFKTAQKAIRYAGLGLLVVTLIKLFLHDLWQLGGLYRIGSLLGLAVVLILVSFIYQRTEIGVAKPDEPAKEPGPPPE